MMGEDDKMLEKDDDHRHHVIRNIHASNTSLPD